MEASTPIHQAARDVMNADLAALFERPGPFVTAYIDVTAAVEQAADRAALHWKNARKQLEAQGAPDAILSSIDDAVGDGGGGEGSTLVVVANESGVLHRSLQPEPPARDLVRFGPLPAIGPLLEWRQSTPSHLVVLADRVGADIVAFVRDGSDLEAHLDGDTEHISRSAPGGWSQRRFQQRAENTWDANAGAVANTLMKLVESLHPRVIIAAGDVRAMQFLRDELPDRARDRLRVSDGARATDGSVDAVADDVVRVVASAVAEDTVTLLEKFREEAGQNDRAADGPARTIEALAAARVETLLIHDDPDDERTCWFGAEPTQIGLDPEGVRALGAGDAAEARLVDVAIRAAAGTGAGVWMVPKAGGPKDGVGALLRW